MVSTALELCGFAALVAASYLAGGVVPAMFVLGVVLLFLGWATDGVSPSFGWARALKRSARGR